MKRILIVDDSAVMRKNLRFILTKAGYDVVAEAVNGEEAYQTYIRVLPDLVTMDVTMPILNGLEAVKKIRAKYADACIIVISAFDQRSMLFEALEHGAKHYIIKPITTEKLLNVITKVLLEQANDSAPTVQSEENQYSPIIEPAANEPVSITNRNGTFVISLPLGLEVADLAPIRTALQGLLFIKPLHIVFDFNVAVHINDQVLQDLESFIQAIRQASGEVSFNASSHVLRDVLQHKYSGIAISYE